MSQLVRKTPVLRPAALNGVALKLENLQRTGSFKLRGAVHRLAALSADERSRGVVTASAGNHGAGLALAGRELGIPVHVYVPELCPENKKTRIAGLGAHVEVSGPIYDEAKKAAVARAAERGETFVSAYDDDLIIEGNGASLGREILDQLPQLSQVICPIGGGGMIAGLGKELEPRGIRVTGAQPENNCAMYDSIRQGRALVEYDGKPTIAEGCEGAVVERTYQLAKQHVAEIGLVTEDQILDAVRFAYNELGLVLETSAAVALAVVLNDKVEMVGAQSCIVLSGGNIDPALLDEILAG